jgi:hypothetical protein
VDDVCNKVISYQSSILIGNICDLINVPEDDDTKVNGYFDTIFGCKITVKKPRNCVVSWLLSFSYNYIKSENR